MSELRTINFTRIMYSSPFFSMSCMGDVGLCIAGKKIEELESLILSANHALTLGIKENHNATSNGKVTDEANKAIRLYYLKYAIQSYNACYDYILQIIYFAFDFFSEIKSLEDYQENLKNCMVRKDGADTKFWLSFKQISTQNDAAKKLLKEFNKFSKKRHCRLSDWANALKHQGGIQLEELASRRPDCPVHDCKGNLIFSLDWIKPIYVTLDEVIETLKKQNIYIVEFADFLYKFIGYDLCDQPNMEGFSILEKDFSAKQLNYESK